MSKRQLRHRAAMVLGAMLLALPAAAQTPPAQPASPYGGAVVEDIIARVNDQIITRSDYDRAMKEMDDEMRKNGATMQQISAAHNDLLRNLIDQQLWLSKGKELGITGDTELINKLNEIRKQYNLTTIDDLEKAAKEQGISYEDFKASIRNSIITQDVMRQEVGSHIQLTPGEVERFYEAHKQDYTQPESVHLAEILIAAKSNDAAAQARARDIESKLQAGGDFSQLARTFSDGSTAAQGGDLGQFQRGSLAKVLEEKTFALKAGQFTAPIRTRQGYVILKVLQHNPGGPAPYKQVQGQVEDAYFMSRMEPAIRAYLNKMRDEAFIDIKPGYVDTGATPAETNSRIAYSAYVPPQPKKKRKLERTRYRETARRYRQKKEPAVEEAVATPAQTVERKRHWWDRHKEAEPVSLTTMKPGKKEKIRFGHAPARTLPQAPSGSVEDAGAAPQLSAAAEPPNPLEAAPPERKTRFSNRARTAKQHKPKKTKTSRPVQLAPAPPDAAEVADHEVQSGPLGLAGDTLDKKKKGNATTEGKTRLSDRNKKEKKEKQENDQSPAPQQN